MLIRGRSLVARKCPNCSMPIQGHPRNCPLCGYEFRAHDPGRCEFCGTRIKPGNDNCPNCGAPVEHPADPEPRPDDTPSRTASVQETIVLHVDTKASSKGTRNVTGFVILTLMIAIPLLFMSTPFMHCNALKIACARRDSTLDESSVRITMAPDQDSIYRASIIKGENTIEDVWPRVIIDLPDSCYYPHAYDPCAAFQFHVDGRYSLVRIDASAPIDLVMTLLRRSDEDVLSFVTWNKDSPLGRDPSLTVLLRQGAYIALISHYGGWDYGEVRFLWNVLQPEIPRLEPDTTVDLVFTDRMQSFYFFIDIEEGSNYVISTSCPDFDSYVELRTEGGSVLSDDDSGGPCWGDARLSFTATVLNAGEAILVVRPYFDRNTRAGNLTLSVTSTTEAPH